MLGVTTQQLEGVTQYGKQGGEVLERAPRTARQVHDQSGSNCSYHTPRKGGQRSRSDPRLHHEPGHPWSFPLYHLTGRLWGVVPGTKTGTTGSHHQTSYT